MVDMLKSSEMERKSCVDYVIGILTHDRIVTIHITFQQEVVAVATKVVFENKLSAAVECVTFAYSTHIGPDDGRFMMATLSCNQGK